MFSFPQEIIHLCLTDKKNQQKTQPSRGHLMHERHSVTLVRLILVTHGHSFNVYLQEFWAGGQ